MPILLYSTIQKEWHNIHITIFLIIKPPTLIQTFGQTQRQIESMPINAKNYTLFTIMRVPIRSLGLTEPPLTPFLPFFANI